MRFVQNASAPITCEHRATFGFLMILQPLDYGALETFVLCAASRVRIRSAKR